MRIVHVSDIHIRTLKYHKEYRECFEDLYKKIEKLKPDLIINTGDLVHSKTQISPELVDLCSEFLKTLSLYAPVHNILGNHDLNLVNLDRQDAISPIINGFAGSTKHPVVLHKNSGHIKINENVNLWIFSCVDENYPTKDQWKKHSDKINIGLYHGSINNCVIDSGFVMQECETGLDIFDGLDYVLLGDIHKHQFMDSKQKIAYAGSLIQQNFGETPDKGFLVWDIFSKDECIVQHIKLDGGRKFYTITLNDDFSFDKNLQIEPGSRIRALALKSFTMADKSEFESAIKNVYKPYDIITPSVVSQDEDVVKSIFKNSSFENLRDVVVQEKLIEKFFENREIDKDIMNSVFQLNRKYNSIIEAEEDVARNVHWKIKSIAWNNMFNYGEMNHIDFSNINGISGIFAPNSSGKSSLIDIITIGVFDDTTKGKLKNILLINDNKDSAEIVIHAANNNEEFIIERKIEKIINVNKKQEKTKEWGKNSLNFMKVDGDEFVSLNGQTRPETERAIRKRFGDYEDFSLISLMAQSRDNDLIKCKETDRRKILSRFLDLEIFSQKEKMARDDGRQYSSKIKEFENSNLENELVLENKNVEEIEKQILEIKKEKILLEDENKKNFEQIEKLSEQLVSIGDIDFEENLEQNIKALKNELDNLNNSISIVEQKKNELWSKKPDTKLTSQIESVKNQIYIIDKELDYNQRIKKDLENKIASMKKDVKLLQTVPCGNSYPTCKFLLNAFDANGKIPSQEEELSKLEEKIKQLTVSKLEFEKIKKECDLYVKWNYDVSECEKQIEISKLKIEKTQNSLFILDNKKQKIEQNKESIKNNEIIQKQKIEIKNKINLCEKRKGIVEKDLMEKSRQLGLKQESIDRINKQIDEVKNIRNLSSAYQLYIEAMSSYGIPHYILSEKIPFINEEINKILSSVAKFGVFIQHNEQEQSIGIHIKYGNYKSRAIELGSGSEKLLASLAIRAAMHKITNLPKTNLFIIDEGFGSLDQLNLDNMTKMFEYLKTMFDHVLIISHIEAMKDMVDNTIDISFDSERYSHVEI